jgi:uncharacterized protein
MDYLLAALASFFAGTVDAIVGGGGLILLPSLFALFPGQAPATLFGSNKGASVWGTSMAAWQYTRRVELPWRVIVPAAVAALGGSWIGAWHVTQVDPTFLRRLMPFVLAAVLLYSLAKKDLGREHQPLASVARARWIACGIGVLIGWYDGFFGPGTGSFFIFALVRLLGFDFLHASAAAKLLNVATNLAALTLFSLSGHVIWPLALTMAVANVAGSLLGVRLALKHGTGFVRQVFIVVVGSLILKTAYDAFLR